VRVNRKLFIVEKIIKVFLVVRSWLKDMFTECLLSSYPEKKYNLYKIIRITLFIPGLLAKLDLQLMDPP